jgi:hypothetical protein
MIVVSKRHINTSSRCGSRRCGCFICIHIIYVFVCVCVCVSVCGRERDNICVRRWLSGARMRLSPQALQQNGVRPTSPDHHLLRLRGRTKNLFKAHGSRHPTRRQRGLWRWRGGGGEVGIGVGGGSRRSGEEEAGGLAGGSNTLWLPRVS